MASRDSKLDEPLTSSAAAAGGAGGYGAAGADTRDRTHLACYIDTTGARAADVVKVGRLPIPHPGPGDVLVRVHACALNPVDYKATRGAFVNLLLGRPSASTPQVLGFDFAGVIVEVGDEAAAAGSWAVGDEVFGMANHRGAFAEFCSVQARSIARKPRNLSFAQAAAVPLAALTADQGLTTARVGSGSKVLVTAGAGGVGHFGIQLARERGASVATTASPPKAEFCKALGADLVINYREEDFQDVIRDYDGGLDCTGESGKIVKVLKRGAVCASILGLPSGTMVTQVIETCCQRCCSGAHAEGIVTLPRGSDLVRLAEMCEAGKLRPVIDRTFEFVNIADAFTYLEGGRARGKVVVTVRPGATDGGAPDLGAEVDAATAGAARGAEEM